MMNVVGVDVAQVGRAARSGMVATGGASSFAGVLDAPGLPGQGNLLPSTKSHSVAFDAGLFSQRAAGAPAPPTATAVLPSQAPVGASAREVTAGAAAPVAALEISRSGARAGASSEIVPAIQDGQAIGSPASTPDLPGETIAFAASLQLPTTAASAPPLVTPSAALAPAWAAPAALRGDAVTLSRLSPSQIFEPEEKITPPALTVVETEMGPLISCSGFNDTASLTQIKAIAESLMLEYSIPIGRLVYKNTLVPLTSALGKGV